MTADLPDIAASLQALCVERGWSTAQGLRALCEHVRALHDMPAPTAREKLRERWTRRYRKRVGSGRCVSCNEQAEAGRVRCARCRQSTNARRREQYERLTAGNTRRHRCSACLQPGHTIRTCPVAAGKGEAAA